MVLKEKFKKEIDIFQKLGVIGLMDKFILWVSSVVVVIKKFGVLNVVESIECSF